MDGWISIYRKFQDWEWYSDTITFRIFFQLLLQANHKDNNYKGILVKRGQSFTSYKQIVERIGDKKITIQNARTAIKHLKSTGEITAQLTRGGLLITIVNYDLYQSADVKLTGQVTDQLTVDQQAANRQLTTNNNDNNIIIYPSKKEQDISLTEKELADNFDKIWKIYPRKEGKDTAFKHYKAWLKGKRYAGRTVKLDNKQMWYAVKEYADLMILEKREKKHIKTGGVFFNEAIIEHVKEEEQNE